MRFSARTALKGAGFHFSVSGNKSGTFFFGTPRMLGISLRTPQDWEQSRRRPNQAAQSLLAVAAKRPDVMREMFG